jgi:hypothetical protein
MLNKQIDWEVAEERATRMTITELCHARRDCAISAAMWDPYDRANGTNVGGYYRDEASVYLREIQRRDEQ